ncbi:type II toxin-antitoxin system Phd/YefM family antitoxin [Subtercola boreus]|nr:hypothetical protein [Subtercola boreus]
MAACSATEIVRDRSGELTIGDERDDEAFLRLVGCDDHDGAGFEGARPALIPAAKPSDCLAELGWTEAVCATTGRIAPLAVLVGVMVDQLELVNMTEMLNVQDAKTRLSEILSRVERGEEFILARGGKPIATLRPVEPAPRRELGFAPGPPLPESFWEPMTEEELAEWGA